MSDRPARRFRCWFWIFAGVALIAGAGASVFLVERRAEFSPAVRGERLVSESGCYACHGTGEENRRSNYRRLTSGAWRAKAIPTLWENGIDEAAVLKDWIADGVPEAEAEAHRRLFIQMPAYRNFHDERAIDDMAAWILAETTGRVMTVAGTGRATGRTGSGGGLARGTPEWRRAGDRLSREHGCYQCHGEQGQGGVRNPAAFKGYIPGFFGGDFLALTDGGSREEILHWIDHGRGRAIESGLTGRLAKYFGDAQAIGMPAYRERLSAEEKEILIDYLLLLNQEGPLDAAGFEQRLRLLADDKDPEPSS